MCVLCNDGISIKKAMACCVLQCVFYPPFKKNWFSVCEQTIEKFFSVEVEMGRRKLSVKNGHWV